MPTDSSSPCVARLSFHFTASIHRQEEVSASFEDADLVGKRILVLLLAQDGSVELIVVTRVRSVERNTTCLVLHLIPYVSDIGLFGYVPLAFVRFDFETVRAVTGDGKPCLFIIDGLGGQLKVADTLGTFTHGSLPSVPVVRAET